jgi:hypothetical protein
MSSHTNTKQRAIKKATARVSTLIYCSGFYWQYIVDGQYTQPAPLKACQTRRAQKLLDIARHELGKPQIEYTKGSWRSQL